jgi:hypothetical protein
LGEHPDDLATLEFDGEEKDVQVVRDALIYKSSGARGAVIEPETTPLHLRAAMDGPVMRVFQPERLEGGAIFQSPERALEDDLDRMAEVVALLLAKTLPLLPSFNNEARAQLIERLRLILALCEAVCNNPMCGDTTEVALNAHIKMRLNTLNTDEERLRHSLQESSEFLEMVILHIPQTGQQVTEMLRRIIQFTSDQATTRLSLLCKDLHLIWHDDDSA